MTFLKHDIVRPLFSLDPHLGEEIQRLLASGRAAPAAELVELLVAETLWAVELEISFGQALACGFATLVANTGRRQILIYRRLIRSAAREGPTLARILAQHLVPVLLHGDDELLEQLQAVLATMKARGTFTMRSPLNALSRLLKSGDIGSARAYLNLLGRVFGGALNYGQSQYLATTLPKAVLEFRPLKRTWQIRQWERVVQRDIQLLEPYMTGMAKGLDLLSRPALEEFVAAALERFGKSPASGARFLALESQTGLAAFRDLRVSVPLAAVVARLNRYLAARTGWPLVVRPMSSIPRTPGGGRAIGDVTVCSGGAGIFLPDEIDRFAERTANLHLFQALTRLESAYYEFHTVDFDEEKTIDRILRSEGSEPFLPAGGAWSTEAAFKKRSGDFDRFMARFPEPEIAGDLFTIFENCRIRRLLRRHYAGLWRMVRPGLRAEAAKIWGRGRGGNPFQELYLRLVLEDRSAGARGGVPVDRFVGEVAGFAHRRLSADPTVEQSALLVHRFYPQAEALFTAFADGRAYVSLKVPYGWRPWPNDFQSIYSAFQKQAGMIQKVLAAGGCKTYRTDIRKILAKNRGHLTTDDLRALTGARSLPAKVIDQLLSSDNTAISTACGDAADPRPVFWYDEWSEPLGDYLHRHVRLRTQTVTGCRDGFYRRVLGRRRSLVRMMRRAFEMLKPEGLEILRRWVDGEEFDYRAVLDYAVERKAGLLPSDRLYMKRLKIQRDVAVLLLVDISRSTANTVQGSGATVLEVEKEAIVLFAEALKGVGDTFAIAAFSGAGRQGVDFLWVKHFHEFLDDRIRDRINYLQPQRNTRMGAAIRHAGRELERIPARVQILIVLGDGFPNDVDYKGVYAAADTYRALRELHARNIHTHGITVNLPAAPQLDRIYGDLRHNVISDVRDLPEKLFRIYAALTRP
jgi:hypothetical protein